MEQAKWSKVTNIRIIVWGSGIQGGEDTRIEPFCRAPVFK